MNGFATLKEISDTFKEQLNTASAELFTVTGHHSYEDGIAKKIRNITLATSKLRLLKAKPLASSQEIIQNEDKSKIIKDYEETAVASLIEKQVIKSVTQTNAVKKLLISPDQNLDPGMVERKWKIKEILTRFAELETQDMQLQTVLKEKQDNLETLRTEWISEVATLKDMKRSVDRSGDRDLVMDGPVYQKLNTLIEKMELMRWMITKLVTARTENYDWLADPDRRFKALELSRQEISLDEFISEN
ncbi:uncharacterized protein LOC123722751 [Papilio machaon]|uniref:uncharacterized protein LOC123722751 n=1 Tax=Papilio machaon TaxID=76193 RepID=UPI001E663576|nr:uncharacterized protein LOC123722751 [Papilio machaon]